MLNPQKKVIQDDIIFEIQLGKATEEILSVICMKYHLSERTFYNHLKKAKIEFDRIHSEKKEAIEKAKKIIAVSARTKAILTVTERKEFLSKLVSGEIKIPKSEVRWNPKTRKFRIIKVLELASHTARISAVSELN